MPAMLGPYWWIVSEIAAKAEYCSTYLHLE
jgi:hypothetical protein